MQQPVQGRDTTATPCSPDGTEATAGSAESLRRLLAGSNDGAGGGGGGSLPVPLAQLITDKHTLPPPRLLPRRGGGVGRRRRGGGSEALGPESSVPTAEAAGSGTEAVSASTGGVGAISPPTGRGPRHCGLMLDRPACLSFLNQVGARGMPACVFSRCGVALIVSLSPFQLPCSSGSYFHSVSPLPLPPYRCSYPPSRPPGALSPAPPVVAALETATLASDSACALRGGAAPPARSPRSGRAPTACARWGRKWRQGGSGRRGVT